MIAPGEFLSANGESMARRRYQHGQVFRRLDGTSPGRARGNHSAGSAMLADLVFHCEGQPI